MHLRESLCACHCVRAALPQGLPFKPRVPLSSIYPLATAAAIDLLELMVQFNPAKRISVTQVRPSAVAP